MLRSACWILSLLLSALCLALGLEANAVTYHVSPFGSNTPPFNSYSAAATDPRSAIDAAAGYGDTVLVHAGEYEVDTAIVLPKGLVVLGVSRDSSHLVWVGPFEPIPRIILTLTGDHRVSHVGFVNSYPSASQDVTGALMTISTGVIVLQDCYFYQTQVSGTSGDSIEVTNCEFRVGGGGGAWHNDGPGGPQSANRALPPQHNRQREYRFIDWNSRLRCLNRHSHR